jgi:ferredoxin
MSASGAAGSSALIERQIVRIDEELCNGCGACVTPCAEGAIEMVDGKARVVKEELCDGAGFCIGVCPTGALSIEVRKAPAFDEHAAEIKMAHLSSQMIMLPKASCSTKR